LPVLARRRETRSVQVPRILLSIAVAAGCAQGVTSGVDRLEPSSTASTSVVTAPVQDAASAPEPVATEVPAEPPPPPPPRPKKVLLLGDSMVGYGRGLSLALKKRFESEGIEFHWDAKTSASVQSFDGSDVLERMIRAFDPDLILLSLGTNNLSYPHPEAFGPNVASLAKKMAEHGRTCVWVGPLKPSWKWNPHSLEVIRDNAGPCRYFDSTGVEAPIQTDHIHPTDVGGEKWATPLYAFLFAAP
jgi:hypothetical protein